MTHPLFFHFNLVVVVILDEFTEDVYFMHEELLQDLEAQYEMNRSIYEQIETWNELFLEFQHFEVRLLHRAFLVTHPTPLVV